MYQALTPVGFLFYEYFVELTILVVVGIFVAALIEQRLRTVKRFLPRSPVTAFVYGSVLPLCACGVVPIAGAMYPSVPLRTIITFLIAAPLLNPYIVVLSASVLGWPYALLRIASAFVLAVSCGYLTEWYYRKSTASDLQFPAGCALAGRCGSRHSDVYETTFANLRKILPFVLIAGVLGISVELLNIGDWVNRYQLGDSFLGTLLVIIAGIPVYFCNGADVLFLKPLVLHKVLPVGTAVAFSLTSTSVCVTSMVLLAKFLGRKLTAVIVVSVLLISLILSVILNATITAFK